MQKFRPLCQVIAVLALLGVSALHAVGLQTSIHVSPSGNDAWHGVSAQAGHGDGPVRTLDRALELARAASKAGPVVVLVHAGRYERSSPLTLSAADSGTVNAPLIVRAAGDGPVVISGAHPISGFSPVSDAAILKRLPSSARGKVMQADLKAQGVTDYGALEPVGYGISIQKGWATLRFEGAPMPLARWPNTSYASVTSLPGGGQGQDVVVHGANLTAWAQEADAWGEGFWCYDWAEFHLPVAHVVPDSGLIQFKSAPAHYGFKVGQRCFFYNLLCELDSPGEWYLDRRAGKLYFWPPSELHPGAVALTLATNLLTTNGTSHLRFDGLSFEDTRGTAVIVEGGADVQFTHCTFTAIDSWAARMTASDSGFEACKASDLGEGGFQLNAGNRKTLTSGHQFVLNCEIHSWGKIAPDYRPAISIEGVGARIAKNELHDGPSQAILFLGNDHLIELNEIFRVVSEMGDAGAIYTGRDWTAQGNIVRYNYLHDIHSTKGRGSSGIYIDDQGSGVEVRGNIFARVDRAVLVGGGRDNAILGNLFVDCAPAFHLDARGLEWEKVFALDPQGGLQKPLQIALAPAGPYLARYPNLRSYTDAPGAPMGNRLEGNICVRGRFLDVDEVALPFLAQRGNWIGDKPGWASDAADRMQDSAPTSYRLRADAPARLVTQWQDPPLDSIGPSALQGPGIKAR